MRWPRPLRLRRAEAYEDPSAQVSEFLAAGRDLAFTPGVGLAGRVWSAGAPSSVADLTWITGAIGCDDWNP